MNIMDYIVRLERRIQYLEANRGTSLRFGKVTEVDKAGHARVQLLDGDEMITKPLRTVQRRTLKDKDQCFPDIGEHVACLFSGQGLEEGLVMGAVYSEKNQSDSQDTHLGYYRYEDGTSIYYDRKAHKYVADVKGDIDVSCTKSVSVKADKNITAEAKENINAKAGQELMAEAGQKATLKAGALLTLSGAAGVRLCGPSISFESIAGGACDATIKGNLKHEGNLTQSGSQSVSGSINAGGSISSAGLISGNPVEGCRH